MKKTIKGIEYETFAPDKNAEELGIDTSRKFIVVTDGNGGDEGKILTIKCDDKSASPLFFDDKKESRYFSWYRLAYYDEAPASKTKFKVGDKIESLENDIDINIGDVYTVEGYYNDRVKFKDNVGSPRKRPEVNYKLFSENAEPLHHHNTQELIIHCTTKQQWKDVCEKLEREYPELRWAGDDGNKMFVKDGWRESERHIASISSYWNGGYHSAPRSYFEREYPQIPITTAQEYLGYIHNTTTPKFNNKLNNKEKPMSRIKKAFMSKESKAIEYYELGQNSKNLNSDGLNEFLEYLYETNKEAKTGFLKMLVEQHKEDVKS